jgi:hypothetical protein
MADEILIPPKRGEFFTPNGIPTQRFITWIESLTTLTNTTVSETSETSELISGASLSDELVEELEADLSTINPYQPVEFVSVQTSDDYTTTGLESLVIATSSITVTLNAAPDDLERVSIKRATTAGTVVISGAIDGDTVYNMTQNYEGLDLIFSVDAGEWLII